MFGSRLDIDWKLGPAFALEPLALPTAGPSPLCTCCWLGWKGPLVADAIDVRIDGGSAKLWLELRSAVPLGRVGRGDNDRSGKEDVMGAPFASVVLSASA